MRDPLFHPEEIRFAEIELSKLINVLITARNIISAYPGMEEQARYWEDQANKRTREMMEHGNIMSSQLMGALFAAAENGVLESVARGAAGVGEAE